MPLENKPRIYPYEKPEPFSPVIVEHLQALGDDIVNRYGGFGSITIEMFKGQVVNLQIDANLKVGHQI